MLLAGASAANRVFADRSQKVAKALRAGARLPEAMIALDDCGEFRWRLENAAHGGRNFFQALRGWHDALEAKAFQQEQAAAQAISTALVLLNALSVGLFSASVILSITQISHLPTL